MTARQTQLRRVVDGLGSVCVRLRAPKNEAHMTSAALSAGSDAHTVITVGKPALGQSYISAEPTR